MPWTAKDAIRKTKKAATPRKARQWEHIANALLAKGVPERKAIIEASGAVKNTK